MADWITKKKKEQKGLGRGKLGRKKSTGIKVITVDTKPEVKYGIKVDLAPDSKEEKKPHSTLEGRQASMDQSLKRSLGLAGGGKAQRGLGRAFMKGGKV